MVQWVVGSILHGVDPLRYFSFQPVLHECCNCMRKKKRERERGREIDRHMDGLMDGFSLIIMHPFIYD